MTAGAAQQVLRLGRHSFAPDRRLVMAIVNRTPDSFYDRGATWDEAAAMDRVHAVVAEGADIVDIGGVPAAPGAEVDVAEEIRRSVAVRGRGPRGLPGPGDQRGHLAARGRPGGLRGPARTCSTTPGAAGTRGWPRWPPSSARAWSARTPAAMPPRTRPFRVAYDDVMADVLDRTLALAGAGRGGRGGPGPHRDRRRRTTSARTPGSHWRSPGGWARWSATGWPVLVSLSNKDFIGETLNAAARTERLTGTLATTAICAWLGARVFRVHQVRGDPAGAGHGVGDPG